MSYYGYKNHVKSDAGSHSALSSWPKGKLIEDFSVTAASAHDSQQFERLVAEGDGTAWAERAWSGAPSASSGLAAPANKCWRPKA